MKQWRSADNPSLSLLRVSMIQVHNGRDCPGCMNRSNRSITSHHTVNFGVELPPAKKIQWLIQYTFYLPCTCRCGNHRVRDGWNETTMWLLCTLVNSVMGEVSDEPCSLRMYIYIYVTISFDRFKYIYIPYINQSNKNEPTTNKYTSRYAVDGINHLR